MLEVLGLIFEGKIYSADKFKEFANAYIEDLILSQRNLDLEVLESIARIVRRAIRQKRKIFMIGNGGSASAPSHSAGDYSKELGARTICLSDNVSALTAWANDTDYSNVFKGQLENMLDPGDVVIGYSGSGNSENVLEALKFAKDNECHTVGITGNYSGKGGGKIVEIANISLIFETESMERIEDMEVIINHIIKESIKSGNL